MDGLAGIQQLPTPSERSPLLPSALPLLPLPPPFHRPLPSLPLAWGRTAYTVLIYELLPQALCF